ncbi:MAG TPA: hypothetical protein VJP80_01815 [Candidatus Saccharimonadales bacterium]|nr:hypothetical protein [Candidatus Saccharimonadales bacterium]
MSRFHPENIAIHVAARQALADANTEYARVERELPYSQIDPGSGDVLQYPLDVDTRPLVPRTLTPGELVDRSYSAYQDPSREYPQHPAHFLYEEALTPGLVALSAGVDFSPERLSDMQLYFTPLVPDEEGLRGQYPHVIHNGELVTLALSPEQAENITIATPEDVARLREAAQIFDPRTFPGTEDL